MSSVEVEVQLEDIGEYAKLNTNTANSISAIDGDIVVIEEPITGTKVATKIVIDNKVPDNVLVLDKTLGEAKGFAPNSQVEIKRYTGALKGIEGITIGVELKSGGGDDELNKVILDIKERIFQLKKFLDGKLIQKDASFYWSDFDVNLYIMKTEPSLSEDEYAILKWEEELKEIELKPKTSAVPFNGVLMLDVSGSMDTEDMIVRAVTVINALKEHFLESSPADDFFSQFSEGVPTKRYYGATLAALMYVAEKIGRGRGEKVAFITFSDSSDIINICGKDWYQSGSRDCELSELMGDIIDAVEHSSHGGTNMTAALQKAIDIAKRFGDPATKPIMFVLLTDGYPNNAGSVKNIVKKIAKDMPNVVLYTVGIGSDVNSSLMEEISSLTGGVHFQVDSLDDLMKWYSQLANDISRRIKLK